MKLTVAVHQDGHETRAAAVAFDEWDAVEASRTFTSRVAQTKQPQRSEPDHRDLLCLLQLLREHALEPAVILLDGAVHLDAADTPGLGRRLYDALGCRTAVIGVSTRSMPGMPAQFEVLREEETRPLIVTCAGIDIGAAKVRVRTMHGKRRIPTLLKLVARIARTGQSS